MKIAIYVRAADAPDQVDDRLTYLNATVSDRGWTTAGTYVDRIVGVPKNRNKLPGLSGLLNAASRHEVDFVMVGSVAHLGTSVDGLLETLAELHRHGVKVVALDQPGNLETGGLLAAADLLLDARRAYRAEAIRVGQLRAKATGVRFGRPCLAPARIEKARTALRSGQGVREAARTCGISPAKSSRIRAEMVGAGLMV